MTTQQRTEWFEIFWRAYPRKVGKDAARRAFEQRHPTFDLVLEMVKALEWQVETPQWVDGGGRFIPHPTTWLNQGRWQDEPMSPIQAVSTEELTEALEVRRRAFGRCPHDPAHTSITDCAKAIARERKSA